MFITVKTKKEYWKKSLNDWNDEMITADCRKKRTELQCEIASVISKESETFDSFLDKQW